MSTDPKQEFKHESYGMVALSRVTGRFRNMFGSSIKLNHSVMKLSIKEGSRMHSLGRDWYCGGDIIAEVYLSSAQFAEMITTPNTGDGVPCTIRCMRDGDRLISPEDPPETLVEVEHIRKNFEKETAEMVKRVTEAQNTIEEVLAKKSLNKADKQTIRNVMYSARRHIDDSAPFLVDQFNKATNKVVTAAKAEIDAFVTNAIQVTGLKQLKGMNEVNLPGLHAPPEDDTGASGSVKKLDE